MRNAVGSILATSTTSPNDGRRERPFFFPLHASAGRQSRHEHPGSDYAVTIITPDTRAYRSDRCKPYAAPASDC
jgi:hypothetical protein